MLFSRKIKNLLCGCLAAAVLSVCIPAASVLADSSSDIAIGGNKEVGSTITATVHVSGDGPYAGFDGSFSYDSKIFELQSIDPGNYGKVNFKVDGVNFTEFDANIGNGASIVVATFKCIAAGTGSIACNIENLGTMDGIDVSVSSSSASVTVNTPVAKSSDATLASLSISPGTLSPEFSASKTSYSATVDAAQSKITVSAKAAGAKAKVSLNGVQDKLVSGENTIKITVTAENGSTSVYTIKVTRATGPTTTPTATPPPLPLMNYAGTDYTILTAGEGDAIPAGFTASTVTYKNTDIPALTLSYGDTPDAVSVNIVYLTADNKTGYFVYDPGTETCYPYVTISPAAVSYQVLGKNDSIAAPAGYEVFDFVYQDENVAAYRLISDPQNPQILLYLMDGAGVSGFFYFDTISGMILPYRGSVVIAEPTAAPTSEPTANPTLAVAVMPYAGISTAGPANPPALSSFTDFSNPVVLLMYFFAAGFIVLAVICIVQFIKSRKKEYEYDDEYEETSYPDEPGRVSDEQPYSHFYTLNRPKGKFGRNSHGNYEDNETGFLDIPDIHANNTKAKMNAEDPDFDPDDFPTTKSKSSSQALKPASAASAAPTVPQRPAPVQNPAAPTAPQRPAPVQNPAAPAMPQRPAAVPVMPKPATPSEQQRPAPVQNPAAPAMSQRPAAVPVMPKPAAPSEQQRPAPVQNPTAPAVPLRPAAAPVMPRPAAPSEQQRPAPVQIPVAPAIPQGSAAAPVQIPVAPAVPQRPAAAPVMPGPAASSEQQRPAPVQIPAAPARSQQPVATSEMQRPAAPYEQQRPAPVQIPAAPAMPQRPAPVQSPAAPAIPQRPAATPVMPGPAAPSAQRPAPVQITAAPAVPQPLGPVPVQKPEDIVYRAVPKQTGASQKGFGGIEPGPKTQDAAARTLDFPRIDTPKREEHVPVRLQRDLEMEKARREDDALRNRNSTVNQTPPASPRNGERMPRGTRAPDLGFLHNDPDLDPEDR